MEEQARRDIVRFSHLIYQKGWVANHDGNLSTRLGEARYLCTPTAVSKGDVALENLIVVDMEGQRSEGTRKVFSEWRLHRVAYRLRDDVAAVIHAHPPTATGFSVAGVGLGAPFMAEPVVSLGREVPLLPYALPGDEGQEADLAKALAHCDVVMLANHGVLAVGPSLEHCFLRIELVEHLCRIALVAQQLGGCHAIPEPHVEALLQKRSAAGLGQQAAERAVGSPAVAQASPAATPFLATTGAASNIVEQALQRWGGSVGD